MNKIIVCDIDGTIADCSHRLHYIQGDKKDWEKFFDEVDKDDPIYKIVKMIQFYIRNGIFDYKVIFVTGRNIICKKKTIEWLERYFGCMYGGNNLLMRKQNDYRPDIEVKPELLEQYLKDDPYCNLDSEVEFILDDRDSMVKKWRELGYTCLQVADGNF